ncbi:MAG: DUF4215 domain-containing protein [Myxococcota bacterium]
MLLRPSSNLSSLSVARIGVHSVLGLCGLVAGLAGAVSVAQALPGEVLSQQKISAVSGGLTNLLADGDELGASAAGLGDLDGDGIADLALGARFDDDGAVDAGAVYVLFLNADGTIKSEQKVSATSGGFAGQLNAGDEFGSALAALGDLDGDGVTELAVGAERDDDGILDRGALWILFLDRDGTVKRHEKISSAFGTLRPDLSDGDRFGAVSRVGDLDGDGTTEVVVGAPGDATGGAGIGAVWVLYLLPDGTVHDLQKIDSASGGFTGSLLAGDALGTSTAGLGDLDDDGVPDIAVGAVSDVDGGPGRGAVWILFMNNDGTVKAHQKISSTEGGFVGVLQDGDGFGADLASVGDLDGDGIEDLVVGAKGDDEGGVDRGALWTLFLNADGTVKAHQKVADALGGFAAGALADGDGLGGLAALGDLDGDGTTELVATAVGDDDGGSDRGAAYVLFSDGAAESCGNAIVGPVEECDDGGTADFDGCTASCEREDSIEFFGAAVSPGLVSVTLDGQIVDVALVAGDTPDQIAALLTSAINDDATLQVQGVTAQQVGPRVFTNGTFTNALTAETGNFASFDPGQSRAESKISTLEGSFTGVLEDDDRFGNAVAAIGDLDGDGNADLAIGEMFDGEMGPERGAIWVLFMEADGSVRAQQKINDSVGGFSGGLADGDRFGSGIAALGDLDGDGLSDLAVGAREDDDGGAGRGAVWILFMNADGTVRANQKISNTAGGFTGVLGNFDFFGVSVASLGDVDGDGVVDLAVGAFNDDDGASQSGAVWTLFLNADGTVKAQQKISNTEGGFGGSIGENDFFGGAIACLGDVDGDGVSDLVVGSARDDDGGDARGAIWVLFLNADGTVKAEQKISDTEGGFLGQLDDEDNFGTSAAAIGDLDGDGVVDVLVGARADDDGGSQTGGAWTLFLNADGTVKTYQKISDVQGGFAGEIDRNDSFGEATAGLGDLDGDGRTEIAITAIEDDDGGMDRGAVWVLSLEGATTAVCGDGTMFFPETCDDGDQVSGDGCFSTCQLEDELEIAGVAEGGSLEIVVNGRAIEVLTLLGESSAEVITRLSTMLNADAELSVQEIASVDLAERLVTNGTIDSVSNGDAGLMIVPEPGFGFCLGMGLLGVAGLGRRRPGRDRSTNFSEMP